MIPIVPSSSQNPKWNLRPATSCRLITESASFQLHLGAQGVQRQQLGSCMIMQHANIIQEIGCGSTAPVPAASQRAGPLAAHRPLFLSQTCLGSCFGRRFGVFEICSKCVFQYYNFIWVYVNHSNIIYALKLIFKEYVRHSITK